MTESTNADATNIAETAERLDRRPWLARPIRRRAELSFEYFPPTSRTAWNQLADTFERLAPFEPAYASVTYGAAGGSTRHATQRTIETLAAAFDVEIAGHLTGVASTRSDIHRVVDRYAEVPIRRIVALRGDAPSAPDGPVPWGYASAEELVAGLRARPDGSTWDISVAGYPETHPKAASRTADLESLKRKVDAGADRVITQFFFDNDDFFRFVDDARSVGIDVPIVPGVMPVHDFTKVARFSERCGARIPDWMRDLFAPIDDPAIHRMVAATVAAEQVRGLIEWGAQHLHVYTLNRAELTEATLRMLGYTASTADIVDLERGERQVG
ncbi:MAG: methylenetetrahydrofolate reductase [Actinomycetota bacterium]